MERHRQSTYHMWCSTKFLWGMYELELMLDNCALYSKKHWLILLDEKLKRLEEDD